MTTTLRILNIIILVIVITFGITDSIPDKVKQLWFTQPLDHLVTGLSNQTFQQRVFVDSTYRGSRPNEDGMPILVYLGGESSIDYSVGECGICTMVASQFHAITVYIEHRFYGRSVPLGSIDAAMKDPYVRGCLTSRQALADFANVIRKLKTDWSVHHSPVIVFGGSYAGMLAAWFRIKYPKVVIGALASSAPVFGSEDLNPENQYCSIASRDYKIVNEKCYDYISRSWGMIDEVAAHPGGVDRLSQIFNTCRPLSSAFELKLYLAYNFNSAAQYNGKFGEITHICDVISQCKEESILEGIRDAMLMFSHSTSCNKISGIPSLTAPDLDSASDQAWNWQVCNELVPHQGCGNSTMFETSPFNLSQFSASCYAQYGVYPHPNWISSYYGGQDLKSTLATSSSNIIFSNGLMDPYSGSSILEDISGTIVAITTEEGSHCLDICPLEDDDPKWLKDQRDKELRMISQWLGSTRSSTSRFVGRCIYIVVLLLVVDFLVLGSLW